MLYVLRLGLRPLTAVMDKYLPMAGPQWEKKQMVAEAMAQAGLSDRHHRDFRVRKAAANEMVGDSLSEVVGLMGSQESWEFMPFRFKSSALQSRATLLLSKVGAGLFRLQCEHTNWPTRAFKNLPDAATRDEMGRERLCRLDQFTLEFVSYHKSHDGLSSEACSAELAAVAAMAELEMATVEAMRASVRRLREVVSCQSHTEQFQEASASWVLRRFRDLCKGFRGQAEGQEAVPPMQGEASKASRAAGSSGGAWRAFIRQESLGQRGLPNLSDLGEQYRQLSPKAVLVERGRCAQRSARSKVAGASAFGLTARQQERLLSKRAREAQVEQVLADSSLRPAYAADRSVRPRFSVGSALAEA